jgi:hypothetical protein
MLALRQILHGELLIPPRHCACRPDRLADRLVADDLFTIIRTRPGVMLAVQRKGRESQRLRDPVNRAQLPVGVAKRQEKMRDEDGCDTVAGRLTRAGREKIRQC